MLDRGPARTPNLTTYMHIMCSYRIQRRESYNIVQINVGEENKFA
jgi:hypothetical protein